MTLSVNAYRIDADDKWIDLPPHPSGNHLAGFEDTRYLFYGSDKSKKLGLKILPGLSSSDVVAVGDKQLDALRAEVNLLLDNLDPSDDYWRFRLTNIILAIEVAKRYGDAGAVVIG